MKKKADLLIHPVRIRIIQALLGEELTVYQLVEKLGNVPQATMYRQLNILEEAKFIKVIEERRVNKTFEKIYSVVDENVHLSDKDMEEHTQDEHLEFFMTFHVHLLKEMQQYLTSKEVAEYKKDGLRYGNTPLYLTDDEKHDFFYRYHLLIKEFAEKKFTGDRKRMNVTSIFIPDTK